MDERTDGWNDYNGDEECQDLPGHPSESPFHSSINQAAFICTYLIEQIETSLRKDLAASDEPVGLTSDGFHHSRSGEHLPTWITTEEGPRSLVRLIETVCRNTNNENHPDDPTA